MIAKMKLLLQKVLCQFQIIYYSDHYIVIEFGLFDVFALHHFDWCGLGRTDYTKCGL